MSTLFPTEPWREGMGLKFPIIGRRSLGEPPEPRSKRSERRADGMKHTPSQHRASITLAMMLMLALSQ